jgi:hypothetical protein
MVACSTGGLMVVLYLFDGEEVVQELGVVRDNKEKERTTDGKSQLSA